MGPTTVQITWQTNVAGNSNVDYGLSTDLDSVVIDDEERQSHAVNLEGLTFNTTYYYQVTSKSSYLNDKVSSDIDTFTTSKNPINIVTGPFVELLSPQEVLITWDTDTPGNSIVEYGINTNVDSMSIDENESQLHAITLTNLTPYTVYYFRVTSLSLTLNASTSSEIDTFTTGQWEINIISSPLVNHLLPTEVLISWDTDIPGNSIVDYGTTSSLGNRVEDAQEQLTHRLSLAGLYFTTRYYYQVTSVSSSLNVQVSSEIDTFTTLQEEINIISSPFIDHLSPTEVLISWDTNIPGNSIVDYGMTTALGSQAIDSEEQISHQVSLTSLTPNTRYYYRITSVSSSWNVQVSSEIDTFTTLQGEINIISLPFVDHLSPTEVLISWDTDIPGNSVVIYGLTTALGNQVTDFTEQISHQVSLTSLIPNTLYYYQVTSASSSLNASVSSAIDTFTTSPEAIFIVTGPEVEAISSSEVLVSWDTDVPANSIVDYGTTAELDTQVTNSEEQVSHSLSLTNLIANTIYYYQVTSISSVLNVQVSSEIDTFSTSGLGYR